MHLVGQADGYAGGLAALWQAQAGNIAAGGWFAVIQACAMVAPMKQVGLVLWALAKWSVWFV